MFCAKDEKHSLLATLWFNIAHYAVRPWPWVLAGLAAVVLYQHDPGFQQDPETGYIRVMIDHLPAWLRGTMVAAFAAAFMSTVGTQLNWGASYLVNDFYRRFVRADATERHYVQISKLATVGLTILSALITRHMDSIAGAWQLLIVTGAGTGTVLILRWYWWRINAWSEVSAMATAFVVSVTLQTKFGLSSADPRGFAYIMLITVAITSAVWLAVTFLTPPEPEEHLVSFYRRVRPSAALWRPIARLTPETPPGRDLKYNFFDWIAGCAMIYGALFGAGKVIFKEYALGAALLAMALAGGLYIYRDLTRRGWKTVVE
jgi:Na+/proline symporter